MSPFFFPVSLDADQPRFTLSDGTEVGTYSQVAAGDMAGTEKAAFTERTDRIQLHLQWERTLL